MIVDLQMDEDLTDTIKLNWVDKNIFLTFDVRHQVRWSFSVE